jgi:hypothetical protein
MPTRDPHTGAGSPRCYYCAFLLTVNICTYYTYGKVRLTDIVVAATGCFSCKIQLNLQRPRGVQSNRFAKKNVRVLPAHELRFSMNRNSTVNRRFVAVGLLTALRFFTTLCGRIEMLKQKKQDKSQFLQFLTKFSFYVRTVYDGDLNGTLSPD